MPDDLHSFEALLRARIVVLDGAMGTTLQRLHLTEADYRGKRFRDWKGKDLKGAHELLLLTRPDAETNHGMYELMVDPAETGVAVTWKQVRLDPVEEPVEWSASHPLRFG